MNYIVITTVQKPTKAVKRFKSLNNWRLIVVGDVSTPKIYKKKDVKYLPYDKQSTLGFTITEHLPKNHYSRKNIGYLTAIEKGVFCIGESDDDNIPIGDWFSKYVTEDNSGLNVKEEHNLVVSPNVVNVYRLYSSEHIWPRGFPLDEISNNTDVQMSTAANRHVLVLQGLADKSPDVDAIHRFLYPNKEISFDKNQPVYSLDEYVYCPYNSQNTLWHNNAFPYLYLPISVSFRFTDILRGYVAQRGLWSIGGSVAFCGPTVYQDRNPHNIYDDFKSEIPCYTQTPKVLEILNSLSLDGTPLSDIVKIYRELYLEDIVSTDEISAVKAWCRDLEKVGWSYET